MQKQPLRIVYVKFLTEVQVLGLDVLITELGCTDRDVASKRATT